MNCFLKIIALSRGFYYLCAQMRISPTKKKQSIAENRWSNSGRLGLLQSINSKKYSHLSNLFDSWWHHSCKFHFPYTFVEGVGVFFLYTPSSSYYSWYLLSLLGPLLKGLGGELRVRCLGEGYAFEPLLFVPLSPVCRECFFGPGRL